MADQKKKLNMMALTGFVLVILSPFIFLLVMEMSSHRNLNNYDLINAFSDLFITCVVLFPVIGRVFSVIGLIVSIVKKQKGKGFAIAGIVISEIEFLIVFGMIFLSIIIALCGDVRPAISQSGTYA